MSCKLNWQAKDVETGELADDILWNELRAKFNYLLAKVYYAMALSPEFRLLFGDEIQYNSLGTPTAESLLKILGQDVKKEEMRSMIEKGLADNGRLEPMDFLKAMYKINSYNMANPDSKFMIIFDNNKDGSVNLRVVDNTTSNKAKLAKNIKQRALFERLLYYLTKAGFDVEFIKDGTNSVLNLVNAEKNCNNLYEVMTIAALSDTLSMTLDLAELIGNLLVNGMKKDPFITRLKTLVSNEEFIKNFKEAYPDFFEKREYDFIQKEGWEEIASFIIAQLLLNLADLKISSSKAPLHLKFLKSFSNFINRLLYRAIKLFKKIPEKEYRRSLQEANYIAEQIAQGFMSEKFVTDLEQAKQFLDDALELGSEFIIGDDISILSASNNIQLAHKVINRLEHFLKQVKSHNMAIYRDLLKDLAKVESKINFAKIGDVVSDQEALIALAEAVNMIKSNYLNIYNKLIQIDFTNEADFVNNMGKHARAINVALAYADTALKISELIGLYTSPSRAIPDDAKLSGYLSIVMWDRRQGEIEVNLRDLGRSMSLLITTSEGNMLDTLRAKRKLFTIRFLTEVLGEKQIHRSSRVLFKNGSLKTYRSKATDLPLSHYIDVLEEDISFWSSRFRAMCDNPDIVGQLFDKITKIAKMSSNRLFLQDRDKLLTLYDRAKHLKVKFDDLVEMEDYDTGKTDKHGNPIYGRRPSGYILQEVLWGKWKKDFNEFVDLSKLEFEERYGKKYLDELKSTLKAILWTKFFDKKYLKWHALHSNKQTVTDALTGKTYEKFVPAKGENNKVDYTSVDYLNLNDNQKSIIDDYIKIKTELDSRLPKGSTEVARLPLMLASTVNELHNRKLAGERGIAKWKHVLMRRTCDAVTKNANDTDYGSDLLVDKPDILHSLLEVEEDKTERIPLFYINLLLEKDKVRLSTDIIGSTMAYAAMVNLYYYLSQVKDCMQLSQDQMKDREKSDGKSDDGTSRAYRRLSTFMDKELYGLQYNSRLTTKNEWLSKVIAMLTRFASRLFLGGNVHGAIANTTMGVSEVFKEAVVGEYFDKTAFRLANAIYFGLTGRPEDHDFMTQNLLFDYFRQVKQCKINLMAEYFDIFGENNRIFKEYDYRNPALSGWKKADIFYTNAWAPYSTGDHYMLVIPFIALSKTIKLYKVTENGTELIDMYDIYKIIKGENENKRGLLGIDLKNLEVLSLKNKRGLNISCNILYLKDRKDYQDYQELELMIKELDTYIQKLDGPGIVFFNRERYLRLLDKYNFTITDTTTKDEYLNILSKSMLKIHDMTWQTEDENNFKFQARNIINRMHGIYNTLDKVEFLLNILGNMILAMRGYALGMIERRWGSSHYSVSLGREVEGSLLTALKVACSWFSDRSMSFTLMAAMECLPLFRPHYTQELMESFGFSSTQFYNMRRALMDSLIMFACSVLVGGLFSIFGMHGLLGRPSDSDPEDYYPKNEDDYLYALLYYFISRLYTESAAYNDIITFTNIEGPNVLSVFGSALGGIGAVIDIFSEILKNEEYEKGPYLGESKAWIKILKYTPYIRSFYTVAEDPRKAAKSFEMHRGSKR